MCINVGMMGVAWPGRPDLCRFDRSLLSVAVFLILKRHQLGLDSGAGARMPSHGRGVQGRRGCLNSTMGAGMLIN